MKNIKNPKRLIILAIIVIVIIIAGTATALILSQPKSSDTSSSGQNGQQTKQLERKPSEKKADSADKLALEGNVEGGVKELDAAIRDTDSDEDKFVYYSRKATLLYNNGDLAGALPPAVSAYQLKETSDSAAFVGQIAREKGDRPMALDYYRKAIQHIDPSKPLAAEDKKYYESVVADLEAGR
ncbi:MAG TPA: hypothetical protein VFZ62_01610 [Candidatus Saccharimonadales bacterium]